MIIKNSQKNSINPSYFIFISPLLAHFNISILNFLKVEKFQNQKNPKERELNKKLFPSFFCLKKQNMVR